MRSLAALVLLTSAACFGAKAPAAATGGAARSDAAAPSGEAAEAAALGRELFGIMDRVLAYKSDHFAQLPKDLPTMGVDSLTRTTVRRLSISGGTPTLVVAYRRTEGHAVARCSGTNAVIEDSMLNGGAFDVDCVLTSGETKKFTVGG
jgi:hypothetical protein